MRRTCEQMSGKNEQNLSSGRKRGNEHWDGWVAREGEKLFVYHFPSLSLIKRGLRIHAYYTDTQIHAIVPCQCI